MSNKDSYTAEEWSAIVSAPMLAGSYISMSDIGITSLFSEASAMVKAATQGEIPDGASDLIGDIVAGIKEQAEKKEKIQMPELTDEQKKDPAAAKAALLQGIAAATNAVSAKGTGAEAAGYKQWIMGVANATAEAGKEGGFLGIGGTRVSDAEKAALAEISAAMGV